MQGIEEAMEESNYLMNKELYAMKLTAVALNVEDMPTDLNNFELSKNDLSLNESQKLEKAQKLVSDDEYQTLKEQISTNVNRCLEELLTITRNKQKKYYRCL